MRACSASHVVFHADDFGMNDAVNQGILDSFRDGVLTSTSLLANAPGAAAACEQWRTLVADFIAESLASSKARQQLGESRLPFDLGIHLNLTQGHPLTGSHYPTELLDPKSCFPGIGGLFFGLRRAPASVLPLVKLELQAQIEWMTDHGLTPTHLNGHQYIELMPQISALIPELLQKYSISVVRVAREPNLARNVLGEGRPLAWGLSLVKRYYASRFIRSMRRANASFPDCFYGTSHAGRVEFSTVRRFLQNPPQHGCTEIGLHPATDPVAERTDDDNPWLDPLAFHRSAEKNWLCSDELPRWLSQRQLRLGRLKALATN